MTRLAGPLLLLVIAAGGLALRLPNLAERPFHADESVHAAKFRDLWERGTYRYDPNEFHGPTLYDATLPIIALSRTPDFAQTNVKQYRAVTVLFGVLLILAVVLLRDGLGWPATVCAALFCAVSPACVFYSRYYIQEMLLVCFTAWTIGCGWQWRRTGRFGWAVATGVGAGLMWSTKETAVFCFVAAAIAWAVAGRGAAKVEGSQARWLLAALVGTVIAVMSGLFQDLGGPLNLLKSYGPWFGRIGGGEQTPLPWYTYLGFLLYHHERGGPHWSEACCWCSAWSARPARRGASRRLARFLAVYTAVLTAIYALLPYKMPWLALGFLHGFICWPGWARRGCWLWCGSRLRRVWSDCCCCSARRIWAGRATDCCSTTRPSIATPTSIPRRPGTCSIWKSRCSGWSRRRAIPTAWWCRSSPRIPTIGRCRGISARRRRSATGWTSARRCRGRLSWRRRSCTGPGAAARSPLRVGG